VTSGKVQLINQRPNTALEPTPINREQVAIALSAFAPIFVALRRGKSLRRDK